MRYCIIILTHLIAFTSFGQIKDRRAKLEIKGRVNEISVAPDEKIWLVNAMGNAYYTESIHSNWHHKKPFFKSKDDFDNPHFDRISFFNKDTAILTGYISVSQSEYKKNGFYSTQDGGQTWKLLDYGGDSWIYDVFVDKRGYAWMGGSSGDIYFSKDYGQNWEKLNSPYNSSSRIHSIFMLNTNEGISGALENYIYYTKNNWKSSKKIPTPFDQKKYENEGGYSDNRIEKIIQWDNYIVVNQSGNIFYTDANEINWRKFSVKIIDFELDQDSKKLLAITDSLNIVSLSTPTKFYNISNEPLKQFPLDIQVVNQSLYIISHNYEIYKVESKGVSRVIPYTTDIKIRKPLLVKQSKKIKWGIEGNQIYLAEGHKDEWYRENVVDFEISDFELINDSTAILWDGVNNNYIYSLNDHNAAIYFPNNPLTDFLTSPIKSFSIFSGSQGCYHSVEHEVNYKRINDSIFTTSTFSAIHYPDKEPDTTFENQVNIHLLFRTLSTINRNPTAIPTLRDFQISSADKKNYLALVDEKLKSKETDFFSVKKKVNKEFYYSVLSMLDTLNSSIIEKILNKHEGGWSTTSNWFTIQIINQINDTLNIGRNYYISTLPWNLPWVYHYKGLNFNCYDIAFSRFINSCIPDDFMDKEVFDNSFLILEIADYLYNQPKK
ncbi:MAG: hypothetical protein EOP00_19990 [Pedobacter sp.]|nr:MAG: hypothetical protein EOP00_19990 [Pedobacter sp.]